MGGPIYGGRLRRTGRPPGFAGREAVLLLSLSASGPLPPVRSRPPSCEAAPKISDFWGFRYRRSTTGLPCNPVVAGFAGKRDLFIGLCSPLTSGTGKMARKRKNGGRRKNDASCVIFFFSWACSATPLLLYLYRTWHPTE